MSLAIFYSEFSKYSTVAASVLKLCSIYLYLWYSMGL